jgi:hypothetical protein
MSVLIKFAMNLVNFGNLTGREDTSSAVIKKALESETVTV